MLLKNYSMKFLSIFLIVLCSPSTEQANTRNNLPYYTAGVVEFLRDTKNVSVNTQAYIDIINAEGAELTDIIVFPESTLNDYLEFTYVPDPEDKIAPCDYINYTSFQPFLVNISCAARNASKYIVINLSEKSNCIVNDLIDPRPCASNGLNYFNTNVAFDRNGVVIGRYRKVNLYGEPMNTTYVPDYSVFETDFDVKFGMFTCFDLLFYVPEQDLVENYGITDFVYPAMWFSQLPFLTAVQAQFGWAYANDVNLLAAGASDPSIGNTGSGIYAGRDGPLVSIMSLHGGVRKLLVARVPKIINGVRQTLSKQPITKESSENIDQANSDEFLMKQDGIAAYTNVLLDFNNATSSNYTLCHNKSFCCSFQLKWHHLNASSDSVYYSYRLGAYNNWRNEATPDTGSNIVKNCAIFSCIGDRISDCGKLFPEKAILEPKIAFEHITIKATFPYEKQLLYMPNTLLDDLTTLPVHKFEWNIVENADKTNNVELVLNSTVDNLMTLSIYGNYYKSCQSLDCSDVGALTQIVSIFTILMAIIINIVCL